MAYIGQNPSGNYTRLERQTITGNGGTSYTLNYYVANENELEVYVNNVRQEPGNAYTTVGTTLNMTGAVTANDSFYVVYQGKGIGSIGIPEKQSGTGNYNFDDGTLFIDSVNNEVGIGTTSPTSNLHVIGTANVTSSLTVNSIELGNASDTTLSRLSAGDLAVEGNRLYRAGGTDVALADGGTGASLTDPNADRLLFWDDSASSVAWLTAGSGLSISGTTITASAVAESQTLIFIGTGGTLGTANVDFINIPSFSKIYFNAYFVVGSTGATALRVSLSSNNGSSFGTARQISSSINISGGADEIIFGTISNTNVTANKTIQPYAQRVANDVLYSTAATESTVTGTINALRFNVSADNSPSFIVTIFGIK